MRGGLIERMNEGMAPLTLHLHVALALVDVGVGVEALNSVNTDMTPG
jgi:hypothetical protein